MEKRQRTLSLLKTQDLPSPSGVEAGKGDHLFFLDDPTAAKQKQDDTHVYFP